MSYLFFIFFIFMTFKSYGLVSSSHSLNKNEEAVEFRLTQEGGFIKPSTNSDSYQKKAKNIIGSLSYLKASQVNLLKDLVYKLEYRYISTPEEKVDGRVFHEANKGNQVVAGLRFNLFHNPESLLGMYLNFSPLIDIDKDKFAVPRTDILQLGVFSGFNITNTLFSESLFHLGSGIPQKQNMYLLLTHTYGLRLNSSIIKFGPYIEADLEERKDQAYNEEFNSNQKTEKIKQYKAGFLVEGQYQISQHQSVGLTYLQKVFGQYLPATNALSLSFQQKF